MRLGDDFPLRWVVENIAIHSTPLIALHPPENGDPFDLALLEAFAQDMALFSTPAFVKLFPISETTAFTPAEYVNFFAQAPAIFARNAPNAALVWSFDAAMLPQAPLFFPENHAHWINLTMYNKISPEGDFEDITDVLTIFHGTFGRHAPLMLTTAVSSYSMMSNRHFPTPAAEKIAAIYAAPVSFPRLRAIIYQNYDDRQASGQDFRINTSPMLTAAYQAAVEDLLSAVPSTPARHETTTRQSPYQAISYNFGFYIPINAISLPTAPTRRVNGQTYHNINEIINYKNADFFVNFYEGTLTLQLQP